jgi:predicted transcriptional regulator
MPPKLIDSETMAFRIPKRLLMELQVISQVTERTVAWHVRRALAQYVEREERLMAQQAREINDQGEKPTSTQTQQAPAVTAQSEVERLEARLAELQAKLERKSAAQRDIVVDEP